MSENTLEEILEVVEEGWGMRMAAFGCPACGQAHLLPQSSADVLCPACGTAVMQSQPARLRREPPELVVPFQHKRSALNAFLQPFARAVWLAPQDFTLEHLTQRAAAVWLPMWLVDGDVQGEWQAQVGFDYQVKSSQEYFEGGRWRTREIIEPRVRWEERRGSIHRRYENIPAPALLQHASLVGENAYDLNRARPYQPQEIQETIVRIPDLDQSEAWQKARPSFERQAAADCVRASGAAHVQHFSLQAAFDQLHWTQILLPAWFTWYRDDDGKTHVVRINAQSGRISGQRMASLRKGWRIAAILAASAGAAFLLALLCFALAALLPPLVGLGAVLAVIAFALGVGAVIPPAWCWQWNRSQNEDT